MKERRDATMSPLKLNSLLTGVFLAMFIVIGDSAMAQDGLRLWKPYSPETFGGARHQNDGVYGSVSGIYWSFSAPDGGYIGATTVNGANETRWAYDAVNGRVMRQTNSASIGMMSASTSLGTRFEAGNRRGHHGWLVSGYGLPTQSHRMNIQNMTMAIRDNADLKIQTYAIGDGFGINTGALELAETVYVWDRANNTLRVGDTFDAEHTYKGTELTTISGIGYLWGYYNYSGGAVTDPVTDPDTEDPGAGGGDGTEFFQDNTGVFAPLPIWFKNAEIAVSTSHYSAELMYTYRAHPFTWGSLELMAGARYWDFDDGFRFLGTGPGMLADTGEEEDTAGEDDAGGTDTGNISSGANGNNYSDYGPTSVLADMTINARANNRIFGPQFGFKMNRQNARWTFGAEGRFTAGINAQSVKTDGYIASNYDYNENYHRQLGSGVVSWVPVGLQSNNTNFGHKQNKTYFSPILELRLTADWQWTNAVSFFGAFDTMYAGNIARGVRVTDYVVQSDGTIFGIRGNDRNTNVMVYGVELGLKVRR